MKSKDEGKGSRVNTNKSLASRLHRFLIRQYAHDELEIDLIRGLDLPDKQAMRSLPEEELLNMCELNGTATVTIKINGGAKNRLVSAQK